MTEEHTKALKKDRDEWRQKYKDLKKQFDSSDDTLIARIKEWVETNDTKELHETYPSLKWTLTIMKRLINGEIRF